MIDINYKLSKRVLDGVARYVGKKEYSEDIHNEVLRELQSLAEWYYIKATFETKRK